MSCHTLTAVSPRKTRRLPADVPRRPRGGLGKPGAGGGREAGDGANPAGGDRSRAGRTAEPPVVTLGPPQTQSWPDGDWVVRQVPGAAAAKTYRCPGCDQEIRPGTAHVVVWQADASDAAERRHWHNSCWQRRPRRPGPSPWTRW